MSKLQIRMFVHSLRSDWNNGNAHFLRGLARSLHAMGHELRCYEPADGWSITNLLLEEDGQRSLEQFAQVYPELDIRPYGNEDLRDYLRAELLEADVVLVHEWNEPRLAGEILELRDELGFTALFHDTHHRAISQPEALKELRPGDFDGVLAYGESLRKVYRERLGVEKVWTLHEAADTTVFEPTPARLEDALVWIGNWGDEERTRELHEFLMEPVRALPGLRAGVYGVRYPQEGLEALQSAGIAYRGRLANLCAKCVYGRSLLTLHIPRQQYANLLKGIPTIRVFEALACGIPLICSRWEDEEKLFEPGDYVRVDNTAEMVMAIEHLLDDEQERERMALQGRKTIRSRHTCDHRAEQLTAICEEVRA